MHLPCKQAYVGALPTDSTISLRGTRLKLADPNDRGMLDVVGFDTTVPAVIADFVRE